VAIGAVEVDILHYYQTYGGLPLRGYECNVTNTKSTLFEGAVGDIPQSAYDSSKAYSFGLFAYPFKHRDQQFSVVNYWVK